MDNIQIKAEVDRNDIQICTFTVDRPVFSGAAAFKSLEEAKGSGVAEKIFRIPGIAQVEVNGYAVTVTQSGHEDWRQIGKRVGTAIRNFLNPPPEVPEGERLPAEAVKEKVQQVLDDTINPGVASHGGYVELIDVVDNNVYLRMGGGCQGCGAADVTLKQGVERAIRDAVPQIEQVLDTTDHASGNNPYYAAAK